MYDVNSYLVAQRADLVAIYIPDFEISDDQQCEIPADVTLVDVLYRIAGVLIALAMIFGAAFLLF